MPQYPNITKTTAPITPPQVEILATPEVNNKGFDHGKMKPTGPGLPSAPLITKSNDYIEACLRWPTRSVSLTIRPVRCHRSILDPGSLYLRSFWTLRSWFGPGRRERLRFTVLPLASRLMLLTRHHPATMQLGPPLVCLSITPDLRLPPCLLPPLLSFFLLTVMSSPSSSSVTDACNIRQGAGRNVILPLCVLDATLSGATGDGGSTDDGGRSGGHWTRRVASRVFNDWGRTVRRVVVD